jgi:hypothetical protein
MVIDVAFVVTSFTPTVGGKRGGKKVNGYKGKPAISLRD